jgi:hypothetical protein
MNHWEQQFSIPIIQNDRRSKQVRASSFAASKVGAVAIAAFDLVKAAPSLDQRGIGRRLLLRGKARNAAATAALRGWRRTDPFFLRRLLRDQWEPPSRQCDKQRQNSGSHEWLLHIFQHLDDGRSTMDDRRSRSTTLQQGVR